MMLKREICLFIENGHYGFQAVNTVTVFIEVMKP